MATNYPGAIDTLSNPGPTDLENASAALNHDTQHTNANDAIEAIEAKLGIGASVAAASTVLEASGAGSSVWRKQALCHVHHGSNQSINTAASTILAFGSEDYDTDTMHDPTTNNSRITVKTAGTYLFGASVEWAANATGERMVAIKVNGTAYIAIALQQAVTAAGLPTRQTLAVAWAFGVNDYAEVEVRQGSGGALAVNTADYYSPHFWAHRIGP